MTAKQDKQIQTDEPLSEQINRHLLDSEASARKAKRTKQSLRGNNLYAEKFHESQKEGLRIFKIMQSAVAPIADAALGRTVSDIEKELGYFYDPKTSESDRRDLRRHIDILLKSEVETAFNKISSLNAEFLPLEIVTGTRGYVVQVAKQINGCYRSDCLDACGVMIRRLLETLIVEVYEKKGLAAEIRDTSGNYHMFTDLVNKLVSSNKIALGRTTRKELPTIATVLNNCAHNRTFNITKPQLVQYQATIVIACQELVGVWDVRKP